MHPTPRHRPEDGFTLIELLVTILIIGVLAAIVLPTFVGQSDKARDVTAKSAARNLATKVEACFLQTADYAACESGDPALDDTGVAGATASSVPPGYQVSAVSTSGATFRLARTATGVARTCTSGATPDGGCAAGSW